MSKPNAIYRTRDMNALEKRSIAELLEDTVAVRVEGDARNSTRFMFRQAVSHGTANDIAKVLFERGLSAVPNASACELQYRAAGRNGRIYGVMLRNDAPEVNALLYPPRSSGNGDDGGTFHVIAHVNNLKPLAYRDAAEAVHAALGNGHAGNGHCEGNFIG